MKKSKKILSYALLIAITFLFGWESASYYILKESSNSRLTTESVSPMAAFTSLIIPNSDKVDLKTFWTVWDLLKDSYVNEKNMDNQNMVYGAVKGMVASIGDPYTAFMTPEETNEFDQNLNGTLEGIGAQLTVKEQALVIESPLKNSPAEKAGLLPGDIVYKIDGALTSDMTLFDAIMKIRGQKGTKVVLSMIRKGIENPFDVPITRDSVDVESVAVEDKGDGIYLINVYQFNDKTTPEFEKIINDLILKDPKGIIIDLRNNGGGYLETSVDILSAFVEGKKEVVTIKRRNEADNETMYSEDNASLPNVPLVVLINEGSASASEIVAGAIKDYKRGVLMGTKSFGKGSVQEVTKLEDGSSIRMTIAKWYTPNGNNIDELGIEPDIKVDYTDDDYKNGKDPQLDSAVEYLKNL